MRGQLRRLLSATPATGALPRRVQQDLADLQHRSELLVAGVQLAVIALLAAIHTIAPAGYAPDAPVRSAPLGLSLFAILVLVRLWFAWTRQLTNGFLGFAVVAEMAILLFTIWTYHLQFETTATIDLKSTHIAYVYVLIALRALRFEARWVILSGLTAALGWGAIVWYAVNSTSVNIITWDYVTYASTRSLYPGAEFDKILAILLVTGIIALVLVRARDTLLQAVSQTRAAEDLSRFFDDVVARKIVGAEDRAMAGHGERRRAAIMFIDLRGFTPATSALGARDLVALLGDYQGLVLPIVRRHRGSIDKFMGDGILASFGAVAPSETYAADALRAAQEIMHAAETWQDRRTSAGQPAPAVGLAVAAGEIVFGVIGHGDRLEYTVLGDAVNLAAKLEKHTKAENVRALCDHATLLAAREQGFADNLEIREDRAVGGAAQPVTVAVVAE